MRSGARIRTLVGLFALAAPVPAAAQAGADSLPAGVSEAMVVHGKKVFTGAGICFVCHGTDASGGTAPSLADTSWIHSQGEYEKIVVLILSGVSAANSKGGLVMPPRGGSAISDADVRAVAAYIWSLSRRPATAGR